MGRKGVYECCGVERNKKWVTRTIKEGRGGIFRHACPRRGAKKKMQQRKKAPKDNKNNIVDPAKIGNSKRIYCLVNRAKKAQQKAQKKRTAPPRNTATNTAAKLQEQQTSFVAAKKEETDKKNTRGKGEVQGIMLAKSKRKHDSKIAAAKAPKRTNRHSQNCRKQQQQKKATLLLHEAKQAERQKAQKKNRNNNNKKPVLSGNSA